MTMNSVVIKCLLTLFQNESIRVSKERIPFFVPFKMTLVYFFYIARSFVSCYNEVMSLKNIYYLLFFTETNTYIKDIIKRAGLRTAVFSFEPMCVVVIIAIQFKSANQRPQNLWLKGQEIVVSLCGHRKWYEKRQNYIVYFIHIFSSCSCFNEILIRKKKYIMFNITPKNNT